MNSTAATTRLRAGTSIANRLRHQLRAVRRARLVLWAGLLHRLARALAVIAEELARRTAARRPASAPPLAIHLGRPPDGTAGAWPAGVPAGRSPDAGGREVEPLDDWSWLDGVDAVDRLEPRHHHPAPQDAVAATECRHGSLSRADVLAGTPTGASAPHEVGWHRAAVTPRASTWANATRARAGAGATPSRCWLRTPPAPRALRYEAGARCSSGGAWRSIG